MDIYDRMNALLKELKMTKTDLANQAGISYNTLSSLYKRRSLNIDMETLYKIAICLNTTVEYLVSGNEQYKERGSIDTATGQSLLVHKENRITAIARGGEKLQFDLSDTEMQAILTLLDSMKKDK